MPAMTHGKMLIACMIAALAASPIVAQAPTQRERWNAPQQPFKVFGNTWWVGTHGIGTVLITSPQGHVLIDGGLPESVPQILSSIKAIGFDIRDVRLIVNSHVHYDHAGGLAELQRLSGARIVASESSAKVLREGVSGPDDPQFGQIDPIAKVNVSGIVKEGDQQKVGNLTLTVHMTPGHTPGGTSWSWRSCEGSRCLDVVYADSLNAVSANGFRFTGTPLLQGFEQGFAALESLPCDILLAAHPGPAQVFEKLAARDAGKADAFVDSNSCRQYVAAARKLLETRLATERRQQ